MPTHPDSAFAAPKNTGHPTRDHIGATEACGCDEAKAWQARALAAEARMAGARVWLRGLLGQVDATIGLIDGSEPSEASDG